MKPDTPTLELAKRWSRSALRLTKVDHRIFPLGPAVQDEIVTTNRLILVLRGQMDYTAEGRTTRISTNTQFLVPAWVRRVWSVPRGGPCEILWCEFDTEGVECGWNACVRRKLGTVECRQESIRYRNLHRLFRQKGARSAEWRQLECEVELKRLIVRFLETARPPRIGEDRAESFHPRVKAMLQWLGTHFREEHALDELYATSGMTRNYFRKQFTRATQCPPHTYIERLRLRHARYLLHQTLHPIKQIAAECGYQDPLYFSRIYHRFWGHPPAHERLT